MWRVLREHVKGFERACGGLREKVLQSCKASTAENMKFSGKKIIAIKSDNVLPYFKANLFLYQTQPLKNYSLLLKLHTIFFILLKNTKFYISLHYSKHFFSALQRKTEFYSQLTELEHNFSYFYGEASLKIEKKMDITKFLCAYTEMK